MTNDNESSKDFEKQRRRAWLALATREVDLVEPVSPELLAQFVDEQCSESERERVERALADDPKTWRLWRALVDTQPAEKTAIQREQGEQPAQSWLARWFGGGAGLRWAGGLASVVFATVIGVKFYTLYNIPDAETPGLAGAWLRSGGDWSDLAHGGVPPALRAGTSRSLPADVTAGQSPIASAFTAGFAHGMQAVAAGLAERDEGWRSEIGRLGAAVKETCKRGDSDCTHAETAGYLHGTWALMTSLRCARLPDSNQIAATFAELRIAQGSSDYVLPDGLPRESDPQQACRYAEQLLGRYGP